MSATAKTNDVDNHLTPVHNGNSDEKENEDVNSDILSTSKMSTSNLNGAPAHKRPRSPNSSFECTPLQKKTRIEDEEIVKAGVEDKKCIQKETTQDGTPLKEESVNDFDKNNKCLVKEMDIDMNESNPMTKEENTSKTAEIKNAQTNINANNNLKSEEKDITGSTQDGNLLKDESVNNNKTNIDLNDNEESLVKDIDMNMTESELITKGEDSAKTEEVKSIPTKINANEKCKSCKQFLNNSNLIFYQGHPQDSIEEFIALIDDKLVLAAGDDGDINERPQTYITGFSIFDKEGHLCAIDSGLVENDVRIYMSGYLKSICCDNPDIDEDSVPVKDVGPIIEWFIHGFDGGEKNCITISTEFGEYNLMKPSEDYKPLMNNIYEKICISKVVVEYLEENYYLQPSYEDLLEVITEATIPELEDIKLTEEMLHKHAEFICDQVESLETEDDDEPLITLPCMKQLIKLIGIKFVKNRSRTKINYKKVDKKAWTKATTTPLVRKTFENFFSDQLDKIDKDLVLRRKRCGICEACQLPDCGKCNACHAMAKFGGHGRTKKACIQRNCEHMAIDQNEDSELEDDDYGETALKPDEFILKVDVPVQLTKARSRKIVWRSQVIKSDANKIYYDKVEIDGIEYSNGDHIIIETTLPNSPHLVGRIVYMWENKINGLPYFHGQVFTRSSETILGELGDPREVYLAEKCCHGAPLSAIMKKAYVEKKITPKHSFSSGAQDVEHDCLEDDGQTYFYKNSYNEVNARFEDLPEDPICPNDLRKHRYCPSCERNSRQHTNNIPRVDTFLGIVNMNGEKKTDMNEEKETNNSNEQKKKDKLKKNERAEWRAVKWRDYEYKKGTGVFLVPGTFEFNVDQRSPSPEILKQGDIDENIYTEYYRKSGFNLRGSNIDTGEPFCIGYISSVVCNVIGPLVAPQNIYVNVNILYRPENTVCKFPQHKDLNLLYWSEEIVEVPFTSVTGHCHIFYEKHIPGPESVHEWLERDPCRFYFKEAYDKVAQTFVNVSNEAMSVGRTDKVKDKGKGKGKGKSSAATSNAFEDVKVRPLRTLDVFAGCGGLSYGLHQSGIAECKWAIENLEAAAHAYALNNKSCTVFKEDCNALLRQVLNGATRTKGGLMLPMRGEVELLCGGPPCQGFSGMNRFNSREYSNFKNSLVASYLSYCDYYRPKYFILENVRNFVAFKKGMVLKLTLRALLDMGYQCTFGVLQAGNYGVPQTRRRLIILAAAPGYKLPFYPEPTHVFSKRAAIHTTKICGKKYMTNIRFLESAPRRTCTISDAMSDLPEIPNGANKIEIDYGSLPRSHFQKLVRSSNENARLRDHICKNMAPLILARMQRIPTKPGSDWRDLPNISVTLTNGIPCKVLQYRHHDKKNGRSPTGALRGVCACASGDPCDPADKQEQTLIPWCLPHTGNRHNHWAGLYGRVAWDGYFSTTVTDPEPMGKQGRVLHPEQHRVVSVRECARSQGFHDTYIFAGSIMDKHRQVGNAVPPPLGAALGREIKKALLASSV